MSNRRQHVSARPLARFLWPLIGFIALLVVLFGRWDRSDSPPAVVDDSQGQQVLELAGDAGAVLAGAGLRQYRAPSTSRREAALQRLTEFRRLYRQSRPFMTVTSEPAPAALERLSQSLGDLLATVDLGKYDRSTGAPDDTATGLSHASPVLLMASRDLPIVRDFLQALEPLLAGRIQLQIDDTRRSDQLHLHLGGDPVFSGEGEAHFVL